MSSGDMKRNCRAFVFIETKPGSEYDVMDQLMTFEEVIEAHIYQGKLDLVAVLEFPRDIVAPGNKRIADFVIKQIQGISEVIDTETIIPTVSKCKKA